MGVVHVLHLIVSALDRSDGVFFGTDEVYVHDGSVQEFIYLGHIFVDAAHVIVITDVACY